MYVIVCVCMCVRAQGCKHIYIIHSTSLQHRCNLEPILSDSNPFGACYIGKKGPKKHVNKLWLASATTGAKGIQLRPIVHFAPTNLLIARRDEVDPLQALLTKGVWGYASYLASMCNFQRKFVQLPLS